MLSLSEVARHRLLKATQLSRWLARICGFTFITGPAVLFFVFFLINRAPPGEMLMLQAEKMLRGAPTGQVWGCKEPSAEPPPFTDLKSLPPVQDASAPFSCERQAEAPDVWISRINSAFRNDYRFFCVLSLLTALAVWPVQLNRPDRRLGRKI